MKTSTNGKDVYSLLSFFSPTFVFNRKGMRLFKKGKVEWRKVEKELQLKITA